MSPTPPPRSASPPILASAQASTIGAEIRPLEPERCVLSIEDRHFTIDVPAEVAQTLLLLWRCGRGDLIGEDLARAAEPLRRLVVDAVRPTGAAGGTGEAAENGETVVGAVERPENNGRPAPSRPGLRAVMTGDQGMVRALTRRHRPEGSVLELPWEGARAAVNRAFELGLPLVIALRGAREDDLIDMDRICHDMRVPWIPVELGRGRLWVGPLVTPGVGASYEDAAARRLAAAREPRVHRLLRRFPPGGDQGPAPERLPALLDAGLDVLADACESLDSSAGPEAAHGDVLHEIVPGADGVEHLRHPVLPMPGRRTRYRDHSREHLIDERTGIVLRVREVDHHPRAPRSLMTRQADVADIRAVTPWANNILCQGSAFSDAAGARLAALGESVERYCGNVLDTLPVTWGSYDELRRRGLPVLDPRELVLYSEEQYAAPGFPFVPLSRDLRVHWVHGRWIADDSPVLVPASLVYVNWYSAGLAAAPPTNFCSFAGIAAGPDEAFAVRSALEEIIERHATMVWWLNAHPLPAVTGLGGPVIEPPCRATYLNLDNEFGVPVAAAIVHDDDARLVNIGFSARPRFRQGAVKALTEAFTLQEGSRDLLRSDGLHWKVMAAGELNGRAFKPWRRDRRYLDDFRSDMHDCDDLMVQQQVYLDPRAGRAMSSLLEPSTHRDRATVPDIAGDPADHYRCALERHGIGAIVVDITTPDVASTGMRVVRVIAPGTVGNAPAAFPYLGRRRVQDLAVELGWRERALDEDRLNYFPLPHA